MAVSVTDNPLRREDVATPGPDPAVAALHRRLPGYRPSPLRSAPALAERAGVAAVLVKDESDRFGLPSFKMLGASWAGYRALVDRLGREPAWDDVRELAVALDPLRPLDLATATDGNHGRAVARLAAWLGFGARIFVPAGTSEARIAAIEGEGASCTVVDGTYDDAVERAAGEAGDECLVVSDTSWEGYEEIPRRVIDGYQTIFGELAGQLAVARPPWPHPTAVVVPIGVGALAAAVARWYRSPAATNSASPGRPLRLIGPERLIGPVRLIGVEPDTADCVGASVRAGHLVEVPGPHRSIMAGLNAGRPSPVAWPDVAAGFDVLAAVDDDVAVTGMRALADAGVVSGEAGAAGAGLLAEAGAGALGLGPDDVVLLISTEGATDPAAWEAAVGRPPAPR